MAFSGTVSQTVFDTRRVVDHAIRRCKLPAQFISSEQLDIAKDQLFLILGDLANQGAPLWCVEKELVPLYGGQGDVYLGSDTVDVLNANLRTLQTLSGTNTDTANSRTVQFASATSVTTAGINFSAAPSGTISFQLSNDNVAWTTVRTVTPDAATGWQWFDMDSSSSGIVNPVAASTYFRVLGSSAFSFSSIVLGNMPTEIPLSRMSRDEYTSLPNKTFQSLRPLQYWFDRQIPRPVMHLWPVPSDAASTSQIVIWKHRYIMDVGTLTQQLEVPQRWYEAIVSALAAKMALELQDAKPEMIPILEQKAAQAMAVAWTEERDNSPMTIQPNISMYTR